MLNGETKQTESLTDTAMNRALALLESAKRVSLRVENVKSVYLGHEEPVEQGVQPDIARDNGFFYTLASVFDDIKAELDEIDDSVKRLA